MLALRWRLGMRINCAGGGPVLGILPCAGDCESLEDDVTKLDSIVACSSADVGNTEFAKVIIYGMHGEIKNAFGKLLRSYGDLAEEEEALPDHADWLEVALLCKLSRGIWKDFCDEFVGIVAWTRKIMLALAGAFGFGSGSSGG